MKLKDRVAIITGGSSGIGRGIALEFAREGARVVVADIQKQPRRGKYHETDTQTPTVEEIEKIGGLGLFIQMDMADEKQVQNLIEQGADHFGGLDILVNNAGISVAGNSQKIGTAEWDRVIAVNQRGVFIATRCAIPHVKNSSCGRIIHISSVLAYRGGGGQPYSAAKAALVNMARDTALELAEFNTTANVICPGYIETAIQDRLTPDDIKEVKKQTPLPRFGLPHDIARAAVFLASDDAVWITGISLVVDGGLSCSV